MKHRIRKTGEIISVISFNGDTTRTNSDSVCYVDSKGRERKEPYNYYWDLEEVDESKEIDWEQRKYETARDILCAALSNSRPSMHQGTMDVLTMYAVEFADELIKQLKNK